MIVRTTVILAIIALGAFAAPQGLHEIPQQYKDMIPQEAREFLEGLTDADKLVLKEWAKDHDSFKDETAAIAALKARSPNLGEKAEKLHQMVLTKLDNLSEEAKFFAKKILTGVRKLQAQIVAGQKPSIHELREKAREFVGLYGKMSPEAQEDLKTQFPIIDMVIKNEKFKKMAEGFLGKN